MAFHQSELLFVMNISFGPFEEPPEDLPAPVCWSIGVEPRSPSLWPQPTKERNKMQVNADRQPVVKVRTSYPPQALRTMIEKRLIIITDGDFGRNGLTPTGKLDITLF
jgi:hypothetical protein